MRGGVFHFILPDPAVPGNLIIEAIPGTSGIFNSTAYDPTTDWVYGVGRVGGVRTVRAYDANGDTVFDTPIQAPYPQDANQFAGTVLGDGRYIVHSVGAGNGTGWFNGERWNMWSIDPLTGAATHIGSTPVNLADFSYNPLDGFIYQVVNRQLYKFNPNDGSITSTPMPAAFPNGSFGASWFDAAGNLFLFRNNPGDIFRVDPNDVAAWAEVGEPGSNGGTDAGSCVSSIDIKKDVIDGAGNAVIPGDRVYSPGDTVTYEITLINNGLPTQDRIVDLCDVLPGDGRTFTGNWTSTDPNTIVTSGGAAGDTDVCFQAEMPSSLWTDPDTPGAAPTVLTVDVLLGDDIVPGEYENQATLDFDQDGTVDVLSDDPGDGSDPRDPTTIEVLGAFTVTKTVEGHPVSNDTDSFPVTLTCTTADGSTHSVAAGSISDAATGAPWPGAATNSFTFANGDDVRIDDLPPGTTCTVTEANNTAYTATVAVAGSGGGTGASGAISTGSLSPALVSDNCQDGEASGFVPFNLQVRNTTSAATDWEVIWRNRPYSTIPNLSTGPFTHTVIPAAGGLFDHVFTGTGTLNPFGNITIVGSPPVPTGADSGCGDVENYSGISSPAGDAASGDGVESSTADITADEALENENVAFTNTTSTIRIRKSSSSGGDLPLSDDGTFTFDITCANGLSETVTITTTGGGTTISYPATPLIGSGVDCTISENVPPGWTLTTANDVEVTTDSATPQNASFQNERALADLTVTKTILGLPDGADPTDFKFGLTVTCTGGFDPDPYTVLGAFAVGTPFVIEDLPVGAECMVTEDPAAGFNTRYEPGQVVTIASDGSEVDVTNSTGSLIIEKDAVAPTSHPIDPVIDVDFTLECTFPDGSSTSQNFTVAIDSLTATGANGGVSHTDIGVLPPGTVCEATETAAPAGWTLTSPGTVTLNVTADNPEPTATFENTRNTGSLTVTKAVDGVPAGLNFDDELFAVDVSCSGGFTVDPYIITGLSVSVNSPLVIDDLPTGADCTVTETPDPRFDATVGSGSATITTDGETVALSNTTSSFDITKTTAASPLVATSDGTFNFFVTCNNGGVEVVNTVVSATTTGGTGNIAAADLPLVPAGSTCSVIEIVPAGWTLTNRAGGTETGDAGIEFVTSAEGTSLSFENTLDTAALNITKDVTGVAATPALEAEAFAVTVECTGNFPGGVFTTTLSIVEGAPINVPGIPVGSACTVTEADDSRFLTTYSPDQSVFIATEGTTVAIENETSVFSISKETFVDDPTVVEIDGTFEFTVECTNDGAIVFTDTVTITTIDSLGEWDASPFLAPGTECSVTESLLEGWTLQESTTQTITTDGSTAEQIAFTNVRDVADLTITKTLLGPGSEEFLNRNFTANATCVGDFATSPVVVEDIVFSSTTPGVIPDLPTGAVCTVTEEFESQFQTLYAPDIGDGSAAQVTIESGGTEAGISNVTGALAVHKSTIGPTEHGEDLLADFEYNFVCQVPGAPDGGTITFTETLFTEILEVDDLSGGQGVGVLTYTDLPPLANGTVCTVTEVVPAGWTLTTPNSLTITATDTPEPPSIDFINERNAGALTITKSLVGVPEGVDLGDEPFTVDVTCTGGFTNNPLILADQTVTANTPLVIDNLPTGAECSVTEDVDPRFSSAVSAPVTIDDDGEEIVATNTTSTLTIAKTTTGTTAHPVDLDATFTFAVNCGAAFTGAATLTTTGQTGAWDTTTTPLLPPGTECTVTEENIPTGWSLTTPNDVVVTTGSEAIVEAAFVNDRQVANLNILKTIIGEPQDLSDEPFTVNISCINGFNVEPYLIGPLTITENAPIAIDDLPVGAECTVSEEADVRFLPSFSPDDQVGVIAEDGATVDIDNRTAALEITKEVSSEPGQPVDLTGSFDFFVDCTNGTTANVTIDIVDGVAETLEFPDLPLVPDGTACTVSETGIPAGWTLTTPNDVEVVANSGSPGFVSFENERDTADLTVTKTVIGAPTGLDLVTTVFTVDVSCSGDFDASPLEFLDQEIRHGETLTFPNLPTGSLCTVIEDPDPRFAVTTTPADAVGAGVVIDADGEDVAIVNATGEIMIVKNTRVTSGLPVDVTESFDFIVNCGTTYTGTHSVTTDTLTSATTATGFLRYDDLPALPDGTACTVTEQTPPAGWTLVSANDVPLIVDSTGVVTASFTNERETGALTVTKTLDGVPAGTDLNGELFDIAITCAGGFSTASHVVNGQISTDTAFTLEQIPTGASCSVTETADPRFATSIDPAATITTTGQSIEVTNTTSTLSIAKVTDGSSTHAIDLDATFIFDVTCTAPDGAELFDGAQTITTDAQAGSWVTPATPLLPPGSECSIVEQPLAGWTPTTPSAVTVETDSASIVEAAFVNRRDTGELTVAKVLEGVPAGVDLNAETFDVEVTCSGEFTTPAILVSGQISVDSALIITDLPTGTECAVLEAPDARFITTIDPAATLTSAGETVNVTNATSTLSITKVTEGPTTHPLALDAEFLFDVTCTAADGTALFSGTQAITTTDQAGSWATPETPLVAPGTECTVVEQAPPTGWTNTSGDTQIVSTDSAEIVDAAFTNVRNTATLTINKTVTGAPEGVNFDDTLFDVTVTCTGDFTETEHRVTGQVSVNAPFEVPDLPTNAECIIVEADDARFQTTYFPESATTDAAETVVGDDGAIVAITNSTGAIIVAKQTIVSALHPIDPVAEFTFTIDCGAVYNADHTLTTDLVGTGGASGLILYSDLPLIPEGTSCAVTEHDETPEWVLVTDRTVDLVAASASPVTASFTNQRTETSLTITKQVEAPDSVDFSEEVFEVMLTCSGGFTEDSYEIVGEFSVLSPLTIDELPLGAECSAVETPDDRFAVDNLTGAVVLGDGPATIDILNELVESETITAPPPALAFTGATIGTLVWIATIMLAGGMFVLFGSRRREEPEL